MPAVIRPFHPSDLPALYRICLLTGDAGGDATPLYRDPDLLGHVYLGPYPIADPGLTFVVVDELGPGRVHRRDGRLRRVRPVARALLVADAAGALPAA